MRQQLTRSDILSALKVFKDKRLELYASVEQAKQSHLLDHEGYVNARNHLDTFFSNVDFAMSLKVIVEAEVPFYKDTSMSEGKLK